MGVQTGLFHESLEDALAEIVSSCGGRKSFAASMWESKSARDAHNKLDACLNRERAEKFDLDELLYILRAGRAAGCHSAMAFIARECGYADPTPLEPEDERAKLQREFSQSVEHLRRLAAALDIDAHLPGSMRVVK
jgi:hypothetical protein